ncbi:MAG: hypothetical protein GW748_05085 [Alphaproteobacteria bacterium]|nr:hypothetical protein [Alphaproteobacteria bacterium]NCQ67100.1 hypothetical protein [Alphaproteobacteria bacterium]NCT07697.1 hypothetical protein [Alphaproteobacteria bacterium]
MKIINLLFFVLLLCSNVVFASAFDEREYSLDHQLRVAVERQKAGVAFDAPLSQEWQGFFNQAVGRVSKALTDDPVITGARKVELHEMLTRVNNFGQEKFKAGEMDTHWYLFLHRLMGEVLTVVHDAVEGENLDFSSLSYDSLLQFDGVVENFESELFLRRHHLRALRDRFAADMCRRSRMYDRDGAIGGKGDYLFSRTEGEALKFTFGKFDRSPSLYMDVFFLPYIGTPDQVIFPISGINEAMTHRIALLGFPTEPTAYDGGLKRASARSFGDHDLRHAKSLFLSSTIAQDLERLELKNDPLLQILRPLWSLIQDCKDENEKKKAEIAFFFGFHEGGYENEYYQDQYPNVTDFFKDLRQRVVGEEVYFYPNAFVYSQDSKIAFYRENLLEEKGIEIELLAGSRPLDDSLFTITPFGNEVIELPPELREHFHGLDSWHCLGEDYRQSRNVLYDYYQMILEMKLDLPDFWRTADGKAFNKENFPHKAVQDYLNKEIAPVLLKIQGVKS